MSGVGNGPPLMAEHQAVHEIRADETLALRARIAELEAEVADLNECLTLAHMDGFEKGRDAARAAYLGEKE